NDTDTREAVAADALLLGSVNNLLRPLKLRIEKNHCGLPARIADCILNPPLLRYLHHKGIVELRQLFDGTRLRPGVDMSQRGRPAVSAAKYTEILGALGRPNSTHLNPLIAWKALRSWSPSDSAFGTRKGVVEVFTDGGCTEEGVGTFSCWFPRSPLQSYAAREAGATRNINRMELAAIVYALASVPPHLDITVFSDSKNSILAVKKFKALLRRKHSCIENQDLLSLLETTLTARRSSCSSLTLSHVRSHSTDNSLPPKEQAKRWREMVAIYGKRAAEIAAGNQTADGLATLAATFEHQICLPVLDPLHGNFILAERPVRRSAVLSPLTHPGREIDHKCMSRWWSKLKKVKRYREDLRAAHLISMVHSSAVLRQRGSKLEPLRTFLQRARRQLLLDNSTIMPMRERGSSAWKRKTHKPEDGIMCPLKCGKPDKRNHVLFRCRNTALARRSIPTELLCIVN